MAGKQHRGSGLGRSHVGAARAGCWLPAVAAAVAVLVWEALSRAGALSALFFPAPSCTLRYLAGAVADGELAADVGSTLGRLLVAFVMGAVPGMALGMAMGWSARLRKVVDPFIAAFHPVPKTALLPLFMVILGIGETSKVAIAALAAFFPVLISSMAGVRQISPVHFEVARNYRARPAKVFTRVVLPGSLPLLLAGLRLGFNSALVVTVAVELLSARTGLGARLWQAWETMRTEELYAALAVTSAIGIGMNYILRRATERMVPWQVDTEV